MDNSEILLYQTEDGQTKVDVRLDEETVWLSQKQMIELFQTTKQNISLHIRNIFNEGELDENSVVKDYLTTASDGKKYSTKYYNLEMIEIEDTLEIKELEEWIKKSGKQEKK